MHLCMLGPPHEIPQQASAVASYVFLKNILRFKSNH